MQVQAPRPHSTNTVEDLTQTTSQASEEKSDTVKEVALTALTLITPPGCPKKLSIFSKALKHFVKEEKVEDAVVKLGLEVKITSYFPKNIAAALWVSKILAMIEETAPAMTIKPDGHVELNMEYLQQIGAVYYGPDGYPVFDHDMMQDIATFKALTLPSKALTLVIDRVHEAVCKGAKLLSDGFRDPNMRDSFLLSASISGSGFSFAPSPVHLFSKKKSDDTTANLSSLEKEDDSSPDMSESNSETNPLPAAPATHRSINSSCNLRNVAFPPPQDASPLLTKIIWTIPTDPKVIFQGGVEIPFSPLNVSDTRGIMAIGVGALLQKGIDALNNWINREGDREQRRKARKYLSAIAENKGKHESLESSFAAEYKCLAEIQNGIANASTLGEAIRLRKAFVQQVDKMLQLAQSGYEISETMRSTSTHYRSRRNFFYDYSLGEIVASIVKTTRDKLTPAWIQRQNELHKSYASNSKQLDHLMRQEEEYNAYSKQAENAYAEIDSIESKLNILLPDYLVNGLHEDQIKELQESYLNQVDILKKVIPPLANATQSDGGSEVAKIQARQEQMTSLIQSTREKFTLSRQSENAYQAIDAIESKLHALLSEYLVDGLHEEQIKELQASYLNQVDILKKVIPPLANATQSDGESEMAGVQTHQEQMASFIQSVKEKLTPSGDTTNRKEQLKALDGIEVPSRFLPLLSLVKGRLALTNNIEDAGGYLNIYQDCANLQPQASQWQVMLARALTCKGRWGDAEACLQKADSLGTLDKETIKQDKIAVAFDKFQLAKLTLDLVEFLVLPLTQNSTMLQKVMTLSFQIGLHPTISSKWLPRAISTLYQAELKDFLGQKEETCFLRPHNLFSLATNTASILLAPSDPSCSGKRKMAYATLKGLQSFNFFLQAKKEGFAVMNTLTLVNHVVTLFKSEKGNIYIQSALDTFSAAQHTAVGLTLVDRLRPYTRRLVGKTAEQVVSIASIGFACYQVYHTFCSSKKRRWENHFLSQMEVALNENNFTLASQCVKKGKIDAIYQSFIDCLQELHEMKALDDHEPAVQKVYDLMRTLKSSTAIPYSTAHWMQTRIAVKLTNVYINKKQYDTAYVFLKNTGDLTDPSVLTLLASLAISKNPPRLNDHISYLKRANFICSHVLNAEAKAKINRQIELATKQQNQIFEDCQKVLKRFTKTFNQLLLHINEDPQDPAVKKLLLSEQKQIIDDSACFLSPEQRKRLEAIK